MKYYGFVIFFVGYRPTVFFSRAHSLEVCGSTRTRGYTRPDPYPRVRVGSGRFFTGLVEYRTGTTSTGTGIPGFTRKEHDFSRFGSENLFISACFLNYL